MASRSRNRDTLSVNVVKVGDEQRALAMEFLRDNQKIICLDHTGQAMLFDLNKGKVLLTDEFGITAKQVLDYKEKQTSKVQLDISSLETGIYFVKIKDGSGQFGMKKLDLYFTTITLYDASFKGINVIYNNDNIKNTLGEVLSVAGKKQIRIAETEKYPHVTFFFSGGQETPFEGESRILRNSPKVATYDLKPEMSAYELKDALCEDLEKGEADFVCLNFANGDMVGHTGIMEAAIKACEAVDICAKEVIETGLANGYSTLLIADHGNCETMMNPDGSPHTAHTTNPVPFILIDDEIKSIKKRPREAAFLCHLRLCLVIRAHHMFCRDITKCHRWPNG